jgi:Mrp family chromosome partitioning ATPase
MGDIHLSGKLSCLHLQIPFQRQHQTLDWLAQEKPLGNLVEVCFGLRAPSFSQPATLRRAFNEHLDPSQKLAVAKAKSAVEIALIHGPPGTGKSTTLVEVILQAEANGKKVSCP